MRNRFKCRTMSHRVSWWPSREIGKPSTAPSIADSVISKMGYDRGKSVMRPIDCFAAIGGVEEQKMLSLFQAA